MKASHLLVPVARTKAQRIFLDLRSRILTGEFDAETRLTLRPLAKEYGSGINAVSEAVKALAAEGLVELEGQAGARVLTRDLNRIRGEFVLRIALECETARRCAVVADDVQMRLLERLAIEADEQFESGKQLSLCRLLDVKFHLTIAEFSGVPQLGDALQPLLDWLVMLDQTSNRSAEFPGQKHSELFAALSTRDPERASHGMRQHCEDAMHLSLAEMYGEPDD